MEDTHSSTAINLHGLLAQSLSVFQKVYMGQRLNQQHYRWLISNNVEGYNHCYGLAWLEQALGGQHLQVKHSTVGTKV